MFVIHSFQNAVLDTHCDNGSESERGILENENIFIRCILFVTAYYGNGFDGSCQQYKQHSIAKKKNKLSREFQ